VINGIFMNTNNQKAATVSSHHGDGSRMQSHAPRLNPCRPSAIRGIDGRKPQFYHGPWRLWLLAVGAPARAKFGKGAACASLCLRVQSPDRLNWVAIAATALESAAGPRLHCCLPF
jgi:hypothetical protein